MKQATDIMNTDTCQKCGKIYEWFEEGDSYPGCKDIEILKCPYCGNHKDGPWPTSGFFRTRKINE